MKTFVDFRSGNSKIIKEVGGWLEPYDWQYFLTLTFAFNVSPDTAKALFKEFVNELGLDVIYFRAVEWHKYRDCVHIHALVGNAEKEIVWLHGMKKVLPYVRTLGARYYVAKFISHPHADWDFRLPDKQQAERSSNNMQCKRVTPLKAIRNKCLLDCSSGQRSEVRKCGIPECALFPYRFGKNPNRKGVGGKKRCVHSETAY